MVQDYFKYDKIQTGAPLSIKANDGTKTEDGRGVTLGIKSTAQGIQHFTNWNDVSSSIDAKNTLRFEDGQPNKLYYKTNRSRFTGLYRGRVSTTASPGGEFGYLMGRAEAFANESVSFVDEWTAEDIKILDDIAVVAYPEYTDLHRTEDTFTGLSLRQPVRANYESGYGGSPTNYDFMNGVGMVFAIDEGMPLMHKVAVRSNSFQNEFLNDTATGVRTTDPSQAASIHMSNQAYNFENVILKLDIVSSGFDSGRTLYFIYGGCVNTTTGAYNYSLMPQALSANADGSFLFDDFRFSGSPTQYTRTIIGGDSVNRQWNDFEDGDFGGYFYLVNEASSDLATEREMPVEDNPSGTLHIQLSTTYITDYATADANFSGKYQSYNDDLYSTWIGYIDVATVDATFIKYTPVRKCGKVDIYTKKSGIISAAVGHSITSPGHTLQTNDIIKITSALWDGTQTGAKDTHPLNGNKFVKVVDVDTFELYEDQFFEKPVTTTKLRTTDGIAWVCIGSSNSNDAQSWSYNQTLFSPTGKNGYRATTTGKYKTDTRYKNAFLSGSTNSVGQRVLNSSIYVDFYIPNSDSTPLKSNRAWGIYNSDDSRTYYSSGYKASSYYGKMIRDFIDNTPLIDFGVSPLDAFHKGPQDFFPFTTSQINASSRPKYTGTRFGSSLDMKFSHMSGNSKVYTLVVGEPGADYSVDMFGVQSEEYSEDSSYPHWMLTEAYPGRGNGWKAITNTGRKRVQPYYQPHGKVHVFSITVDQYGRISDITAQNTLFGDGSSVNNTCSNEEHPWETFMTDVRSNHYVGVNTTAGRRQMQAWSYDDGTFDIGYTVEDNGDKFSVIRMENRAPFNEVLPDDSSLYWDRAAIVNWLGVEIYDYFRNESNQINTVIRRGPLSGSRNRIFTNSINIAYSRFGLDGLPYGIVIDRFNETNAFASSNFYIMPWVDMFGKSVAVSNCNESGSILVFGAATVRSNIDYHGVPRADYGGSGNYGETALRPVCTIKSGLSNDNVDEYSVTQNGQISCIRVNRLSSYNTTQIVEINSGGSVDSSTTPVDYGQVFSRVTTDAPTFTIRELRTGEKLNSSGSSVETVLRSIKESMMSIIFDGEYLIFGQHNIEGGYSNIHMLRIDFSNNSFYDVSSVSNYFVLSSSSSSSATHEGFGEYICYNNNVLVTNALTGSNSNGISVNTLLSDIEAYDTMLVFTNRGNGLKYHQQLSPTFSSLDQRYSSKLLSAYSEYLLDINNINYDNNTFHSHTWNMRLAGKYDTIAGKIILKDPIEYVLFATNNQYSSTNQSAVQSYIRRASPYLEFTEIYKGETVYYDYGREDDKDYQYKILDRSEWTNISPEQFSNTEHITRTPVFFLSVPVDSIDDYGNLSITVNKNPGGRIFGSTIDINSLSVNSIANSNSSLIPQIALYRKDPRAMIVPNGPSATGSDSTSPATYTNGLYNFDYTIFRNDDPARIQTPATPPLFRGGANDLFLYSSNPGSSPVVMVDEVNNLYDYTYAKQYFNGYKNLGELFDATYNQLGNVNKGIISWFANDVRGAAENAGADDGADCVPYGTIISSATTIGVDRYVYTIPYSVWSQFVVDTPLIKGPDDNRPMFADLTRIKHGTAGIDIDPLNGAWDYTYNDTNRPTYIGGNVKSGYSLIIGLVFTRHGAINQDGSVQFQLGNIYDLQRFIGQKESNDQRYSSNYSYTPLFGATVNASSSTNFARRAKINNLHLETYIGDIDFDFNVTSRPKQRFNAKYHKIAYFEYNNEVYSDTQRSYIEAKTSDVERYAFGKYSFVPYPVGPIVNYRTSTTYFSTQACSINPIIRVGKSKSSTQISQGNAGTFNDSIQVLATENVGNILSVDTTFYVNDGGIYAATPSGVELGKAYFSNKNMLGSFDIEQPEGLSLFISVVRSENGDIPLMIRNQISSGNITLDVAGYGFTSGVATLSIKDDGTLAKETDLSIYGYGIASDTPTLFTKGQNPVANSGAFTLDIDGVVGSGLKKGTELFVSAPLEYPGTSMPLWIGRHIVNTNELPVYIEGRYVAPGGWTGYDNNSTLYMSGSFNPNAVYTSGSPLFITGPDEWIVSFSSGAPLYISTDIPESGSTVGWWVGSSGMSLVIVDDNKSLAAPLVVEGAIASTGSMPLYIERAWANSLPLSIKNQSPSGIISMSVSGAFVGEASTTLYISPPTANNTKLYTRGFVE